MNKYLSVGSGGYKCSCCFPPPGSYARRKEFRSAKRKEQKENNKIICEEIINMED